MSDCIPDLVITSGDQLTPLAFVLSHSGNAVELAGASVEAQLRNEADGTVALDWTDTGITVQPTRNVSEIDADGWFRIKDHKLSNGSQVRFTTDGTLPNGIVAGTPYFVRDSSPNQFKICARPNSMRIKPTGGTGTHVLTQVGLVYWELPEGVEAGTYRVWLRRTVSDKTDVYGYSEGVLLTVK